MHLIISCVANANLVTSSLHFV